MLHLRSASGAEQGSACRMVLYSSYTKRPCLRCLSHVRRGEMSLRTAGAVRNLHTLPGLIGSLPERRQAEPAGAILPAKGAPLAPARSLRLGPASTGA